jgi:hypothetical protein
MANTYAHAKAYRTKGGAVVTITRADGKARRHKVSGKRFTWLRELFSLAADRGSFCSGSFDCQLSKPLGPEFDWLREQR